MSIEETLTELLLRVKSIESQLVPAARLGARAAYEEQRADEIIGCEGLGLVLGVVAGKCSVAEVARKRVERDPKLRALAISGGDGKQWRWRRREVEGWLATRRGGRRSAA